MTSESGLETYLDDGQLRALVVRHYFVPSQTTFVTPGHCNQQIGFVVYASGSTIPRHAHLQTERRIVGTTEVVLVRHGHCTAQIYTASKDILAEIQLQEGDLIFLNGGAHGFLIHADTVLLEVKQGPFIEGRDKERF